MVDGQIFLGWELECAVHAAHNIPGKMSEKLIAGEPGKTVGGRLEVQVECQHLANMDTFSLSDPFALLEICKDGQWEEVGKWNGGREDVCLTSSEY